MTFGLMFVSLLLTAATAFSNPISTSRLKYVHPGDFDTLKYNPPAPNSAADLADLNQVLERTRRATESECARARSQYNPGLKYVFGPAMKTVARLDKETIDFINHFFSDNLFLQFDYFVYDIKERVNRPRPYLRNAEIYAHLLKCMEPHSASSYLSGHAALSRAGARLLIDLYPQYKQVWDKEAELAGENRVLAGLHHYTDVRDGAKMADEIYDLIKRTPAYQSDLSGLKKNLDLK